MKLPFYYWLNKRFNGVLHGMMKLATPRSADEPIDLRQKPMQKILVVRANFRLGDSILATPAILLLRKNFPQARIDFVGASIAKILFQRLPIDHHYLITRRFPEFSWVYVRLLQQIRAVGYDLAIDVSGSQSALGAFIVGFSGARLRAGLRGKRDRWYNVRLRRPAVTNKYRNLPALVAALGLKSGTAFPSLGLSPADRTEGASKLEAAVAKSDGPIVGVFVGGRRSVGKRWPATYFLEILQALRAQGSRVAIFIGPEEKNLREFFEKRVPRDVPVISEPSPWMFALMVARCDLFVTCDSGPMHLACAVEARTVAIFLKDNYDRWGPPPELGRIVYRSAGVSVNDVVEVCREELFRLAGAARTDAQTAPAPAR